MKDLSHCLRLLLYWTQLLQASCSALQTWLDLVEAAKAFIKDMSQSQLLEPTVHIDLAQGENDEIQPSSSHNSTEDAEAAPQGQTPLTVN